MWRGRGSIFQEKTMIEKHAQTNLASIDNKGFTLVEVLIAMAIFSIGILAVGAMQLSSTQGSTSSRIYTESSVWAQDTIETLMQLRLTPTVTPPELATGVHAATPVPNAASYSVEYTVWDNAGGPIGTPPTPSARTGMLNGKTPTPGTIIVEVTVTGRDNRSSTMVFVRGVNI